MRVKVGDKRNTFYVHENTLLSATADPEIFVCLKDTRGNISLADDDPETFSLLLTFLYRRTTPILDTNALHLVRPLYYLAERL